MSLSDRVDLCRRVAEGKQGRSRTNPLVVNIEATKNFWMGARIDVSSLWVDWVPR